MGVTALHILVFEFVREGLFEFVHERSDFSILLCRFHLDLLMSFIVCRISDLVWFSQKPLFSQMRVVSLTQEYSRVFLLR